MENILTIELGAVVSGVIVCWLITCVVGDDDEDTEVWECKKKLLLSYTDENLGEYWIFWFNKNEIKSKIKKKKETYLPCHLLQ